MNRNIIILSIILTLVTVARAVAGAPFNVTSHSPTGNGQVINQNGTVSATLNQAPSPYTSWITGR